MEFIVPLYTVAGAFAIAISFPSVVTLIKTKRSDELSLTSWTGWLAYQIIALVYSVTLNAPPLIMVNALWVSFYIVMIYLILLYRKNPAKKSVKRRKK